MNTAIGRSRVHIYGLCMCAINGTLGQLHTYERGWEKLIKLLKIRPFLYSGIDNNDGGNFLSGQNLGHALTLHKLVSVKVLKCVVIKYDLHSVKIIIIGIVYNYMSPWL